MMIFGYIFKICKKDSSSNQYSGWVQCGRYDPWFHYRCPNIDVDKEAAGKDFYC